MGLLLKHGIGRSKGFLQSYWPLYTPSPGPEQSLNLKVSLVSGQWQIWLPIQVSILLVTCIICHQRPPTPAQFVINLSAEKQAEENPHEMSHFADTKPKPHAGPGVTFQGGLV
jgi:hypothetical protein